MGTTDPPERAEVQTGEVWGSVATSGRAEFRICALVDAADAGTPGVHLRVIFTGEYPSGESNVVARLMVAGDDGTTIAESAIAVAPPEAESKCSPFAVDLEGTPLESGPTLF